MKRIFTFLAVSAMLFAANAQEKVYVHTKGVAYEFDAADVDEINFVKGSDKDGALQERWIAKMEFVDLGLSVKWAKCNLGAETPANYGDYYAWGETMTKEEYNRDNSAWYNVSWEDLKTNGVIDDNKNLTAQYDAATAVCEDWRMPTLTEIEELLSLERETTTMKDDAGNEVLGYLFRGKGEKSDNTLFVPLAGHRYGSNFGDVGIDGFCWSATAFGQEIYAHCLGVYTEEANWSASYSCHYGFSVRAVLKTK